MARRKGSTNLSFYVRKLGVIIRNFLAAGRKAEECFKKSVVIARQIGAIGVLGQASLGLGLFYTSRGKTNEARKYYLEAIEAFEKCGAEGYLKRATGALVNS